ncbi:hypothetical protein [Jatrophihabitans lederbergiae]|uniref:Uncharacterized protein n=1 Tax=Jatrophihabitans lederbergiae TaxID=3075547 RepID=A0ABU2JBI3_9ACTN|nr:hypothetical protein [Jatrophihabitans sp. DSM 44399]MDT0262349.1 hypothetical protein [Jatrophihabitans sp. DSM 44399]
MQPPQTFDELVTAAKKLTTKDVKGLFVGNDGGGGVLAGPVLWSVGALDFAQSYGFHIPARQSLAAKADKLKSGTAAEAVDIVNKHGRAQTPLLWTPAAGTALSDAVT